MINWFMRMVFLVEAIITMTTRAEGQMEMILQCPEQYSLRTVSGKSKPHIGDGGFLVSVCCPISHPEGVFFGREGVGCCPMEGLKCVFTCKCKDNSYPLKSERPIIEMRERIRRHVNVKTIMSDKIHKKFDKGEGKDTRSNYRTQNRAK